MLLLGHNPGTWKKNHTYWCRCRSCGLKVNVKIGLKISDLPETECPGGTFSKVN